jgi:hypothetical protein
MARDDHGIRELSIVFSVAVPDDVNTWRDDRDPVNGYLQGSG